MPSEEAQMTIWNNRKRAQQLIDFSTLRRGKVYCTDVDGVLEWHDKLWIWLEYKYMTAPVPEGQKLMLERLADDLERAGKISIVIVASHNRTNPDEDVAAGLARVRAIYYHGKWRRPKGVMTVKNAVNEFIKTHEGGFKDEF